jgi:hypothetical protein
VTSTVGVPEQAARLEEPGGSGLSERTLGLVVAVVTLPILWMGYGTDIDVHNVLRVIPDLRDGHYEPSRTPGVPVVETIAAILDPVGGHLLINLATAVAAGFMVVGIARLVREWGHANGDLVALAFFASPVTIIAATSLADFVWALVFFVWGALAHLRNRSLLAGALFALSIGCRLSTGFLLVAFLVADGWDPAARRRCLRTAAVTLPLGVLLYIPSWLAYDRTFRFLETSDGYKGFANNLGRFLYKNYANAGVVLIVVVLVAVPALIAALRHWGNDPMLRFAVLMFGVSELLFFQLPWKGAHLLPALLALLLWIGASARNERRYLWIVVAAIAVNGVVGLRLLAPDNPDESTKASWNPAIGLGLLANDIDCRLDFMDVYPTKNVSEAAWSCTLKPMRGSGEEVTPD